MTIFHRASLFIAPLALIAANVSVVAPLAAQAPAQTDWNRVVTQAPNGAFVLGNPKAQTRVIEYFSYTCSHCAHFMVEGMGPLRTGWIRRGLVSIEFRNAVRDPYDMTAALLARCGGKARFVSNHEVLFNNFTTWMPRLVTYDEARDKTTPTDKGAAMRDIAVKTGLSDLLAKRGLTPAAQNACLADKAQAQAVLAMTQEAWQTRKISGTPFFLVNGKVPDINSEWQGLKAALPALPAGSK